MPKKLRKPSYLHHKASGRARVRLRGRDIYLDGEYGSVESYAHYERICREWLLKQDVGRLRLTVDELCILYTEHASRYYLKDGKTTCEVNNVRIALRPLVLLYGTTRAAEFGPSKLKAVREAIIEGGNVRSSINRMIGRIKRMFKWAVSEELVPTEVHVGLSTVSGFRKGRCKAKESEPVKPVSAAAVDAIMPHVSRQVWAMVQLQILTGMRPGEVIAMRGCDMIMSGKVWEYRPESHKTEHHGKSRIIFIGPRAQAVIRDFLKADLAAYLFSPAEARTEFDQKRKADRTSPMTPSQRARQRKATPQKKPGKRYTIYSYRQAVVKGCEKAWDMPPELRNPDRGLPKLPEDQQAAERQRRVSEARQWRQEHCWHPHQLRHSAATTIRREAGLDTARTVLGHSSLNVAEVYAERDENVAREIMGRIG
jgi:integrase